MNYEEWSNRHPEAAKELNAVFAPALSESQAEGKSESWAQQKVRLAIAQRGGLSWRNNVGATPAKCQSCGARQRVVRYGLANDSTKVNARLKSHDLICALPRIIQQKDVGTRIAQFGSIEVKKPGWTFTGKGREDGQAAWAALILSHGGFSHFSTGAVSEWDI